MKNVKLILLGIVAVAAIVLLVIFYNPLMAKIYHGKMDGFEIRQGQNYDHIANEGITGFVKMGGSAVPYLAKYLDADKDDGVRIGSAIALGKIGATPQGIGSLIRGIERGQTPELNSVIWALAQYKKVSLKDMLKVLKTSKNAEARAAAIKVLAKISDKSAAPDIAAALKDSSLVVVKAAATTMSSLTYPEATQDLVDAIRRIATDKNKDENALSAACSALIANIDDNQATVVFAELGKNDVLPLLNASREYCKKLSFPVLMPYLKAASVSSNKIERESSLIVASALTADAKEHVAGAALSDSSTSTVLSALEMLRDVGTSVTLEKVINLVHGDDKEIASSALITMGKIVDRNNIGDPPLLTTNPKDNPRDEYIIIAIECLKDPNLRIAASRSLELLSRQTQGTSYEDWNGWWNDFKNTTDLVKELLTIISSIDLEHKTKEAFEKANPLITRAEAILEKLTEIAARNSKIAAWVDKQQERVNQLRYMYNKSKPLDIMH